MKYQYKTQKKCFDLNKIWENYPGHAIKKGYLVELINEYYNNKNSIPEEVLRSNEKLEGIVISINSKTIEG